MKTARKPILQIAISLAITMVTNVGAYGQTPATGSSTSSSALRAFSALRSGASTAKASRFPDQEVAVILLMNRYKVSSFPMMQAVLRTFMPCLGSIPEP